MTLKFDFMICGPLVFGRIAIDAIFLLSSMDVRSTFLVFLCLAQRCQRLQHGLGSALCRLAKVWGSSKLTASRSRPWKIRCEQIVNMDMSLWLVYLVILIFHVMCQNLLTMVLLSQQRLDDKMFSTSRSEVGSCSYKSCIALNNFRLAKLLSVLVSCGH